MYYILLDYGHAYTGTIWGPLSDRDLLLIRVLRIEFRLCRNHILHIDDSKMDDYRKVLAIFMNTCDLRERDLNSIFRITCVYTERFDKCKMPDTVIESFSRFCDWINYYLYICEDTYKTIAECLVGRPSPHLPVF